MRMLRKLFNFINFMSKNWKGKKCNEVAENDFNLTQYTLYVLNQQLSEVNNSLESNINDTESFTENNTDHPVK